MAVLHEAEFSALSGIFCCSVLKWNDKFNLQWEGAKIIMAAFNMKYLLLLKRKTPHYTIHLTKFGFLKSKPFGNLGIGISASALASTSASALQKKFFFLTKSLFLPFEVLYEENIHGEVLLKYTCWPSWKFQPIFGAVIL